MPYIKSISIRNTVAGCLKYIENSEKTQGGILVTGINCSDDIAIAEKEMCLTYQNYSHHSFYAKPLPGKSPVKAFHFVQSFKADECTPEQAHKIGREWVRKAFGDSFQAVVTTHTDTGNVHNHICICPYDLNGKKYNGDKKSLKAVRRVSDVICKSYELGAMEKLTSEENHISVGVSYGEWRHRKQGTSWKEIIRNRIDILIRSASSLPELLEEMERQGYTVKYGKYISVKAPEQQRAVRLKTLGAEFTEESISRRIWDYLDSLTKIKTVGEIISEVMEEFTRQTRTLSFAKSVTDTITTLGNRLAFIGENKITSISQAEEKLRETELAISEMQARIDELTKLDGNYSDEISALREKLNAENSKADRYRDIIETYKNSADEDYISRLVRAARDRMDEQERLKANALEKETFEIFAPNIEIAYGRVYAKERYGSIFSGSLSDYYSGDIRQTLENIYEQIPGITAGMIISVDRESEKTAYYVAKKGFTQFEREKWEQLPAPQKTTQQEEQKTQTAVKKKCGR